MPAVAFPGSSGPVSASGGDHSPVTGTRWAHDLARLLLNPCVSGMTTARQLSGCP